MKNDEKYLYRYIEEHKTDIEGWERELRNHPDDEAYVDFLNKKITELKESLLLLEKKKEELKI